MAMNVFTGVGLWFAGLDLGQEMNAVALAYGAEAPEATPIGATVRERLGGLKTIDFQGEGYYDASGGEPTLFADLGLGDLPISIAPAKTVGETAFLFQSVETQFAPGGTVGDVLAWSLAAGNSGKALVRGALMHDAVEIASDVGIGVQLGAAAAGQRLYGALHVPVASVADTLDVTVESDATDAWIGAETTRLTFAQQTAVGFDWQELAGPITDPWYRINFTIGGTAPSFGFAVALGIA